MAEEGSPALTTPPNGYADWLTELKSRIHGAQQRAALAVNRELVLLYWQIGRDILERQEREGWGSKVIERLAHDLRAAFPEMKGFSARNLRYMKAFASAWPDEAIVQQAAAQLPWFHLCTLMDRLKDPAERSWYLTQAIENAWSRNVLAMQIDSRAHLRAGQATTNFATRLPAPQSDLARESLKDPYRFDFLSLGREAHERDLEQALVDHISRFLLELGAGFAYVGRQVPLSVGGEDFYVDLLFYHLKLRCYVVVELKAGAFRPEHVGQLNFYLSVVDEKMRHADDGPTIGLLMCQTHNKVVAEYALRNSDAPIGVTRYELATALPEGLRGSLPTIEQIERELTGPDAVTERRPAVYDPGGQGLDPWLAASPTRILARQPW